jgi:hypothetical protein
MEKVPLTKTMGSTGKKKHSVEIAYRTPEEIEEDARKKRLSAKTNKDLFPLSDD